MLSTLQWHNLLNDDIDIIIISTINNLLYNKNNNNRVLFQLTNYIDITPINLHSLGGYTLKWIVKSSQYYIK